MKFIFVITDLSGGGAEKAIVKICKSLVDSGHQAKIILLNNKIQYLVPEGVVVDYLLEKRFSKGWLGKRLLAFLLKNKLKKIGAYDLVVSTLPLADEICYLANLQKHVCRIANTLSVEISLGVSDKKRLSQKIKRAKQIYGEKRLVAVSEGVKSDLVEWLGFKESNVYTIYNLYDFKEISELSEQGTPPQGTGPYVLHVGRFSTQKRHDLLLEAFGKIDNKYKLILLADPNQNLQAMIDQKGLTNRVLIAGFQKNPYPWMRNADLLVLCSDYEGLPNVLIEALICGAKVVSTNCPSGPVEILGDKNDCLVKCGDSLMLSNVMADILSGAMIFEKPNLDKFSINNVVKKWESLAKEVSVE